MQARKPQVAVGTLPGRVSVERMWEDVASSGWFHQLGEGRELTFAAKVQGEVECAAGGSYGIECCGYILYPASGDLGLAIGRQAEKKECEAVDGKWD